MRAADHKAVRAAVLAKSELRCCCNSGPVGERNGFTHQSGSCFRTPHPVDIRVENHGSLFLLRPLNDNAVAWLVQGVDDGAQFFGGALVVEPRYVADIVNGAREAGLEVR